MDNLSRKSIVPVDVELVKNMLDDIGRRISPHLDKKSFVEIGWASINLYTYRMLQSKLSRGGLDFRAICKISSAHGSSWKTVIINVEDSWFDE